ncbi:hypothetical protein KFK09_021760 [Dendrobium nobile]|uniref:TOD1/MUCI70 glycosyltransferase-like domain-containing protein n=1 Tax=Dendrobium nobile TaxID=94219 RepID=A0A8T3AGW4_DENNO|nr:hypothetical protein KFK09_021760 [Dendrobium nobile]
MALFQSINESSQPRRGRRLSRVARRRCLIWTFLLSTMSLIYLSFVGSALLHSSLQEKLNGEVSLYEIIKKKSGNFDDRIDADKHAFDGSQIFNNGTSESTTSHQTIIQIVKISKDKSHKKHGPCEVSFTKSVEYLLHPENYMNFTKFSLDYVLQEQHYSNNSMLQPKFGGHQTLEERENSYYARNETLHCGFVKGPEGYPSAGFDVNEKDKEYMARCRVAVSSCIFGSSDFLRRPKSKLIGTYSKKNVCFLMFLDELTMRKLSLEGQVPDDEGYIGLWKIVLVKKLPYTDMRKTGKVPKFLSHRLFPSAWYSIWIDSKMRLQTDPMLILEYFLWRKKSEYAISNHYDRHCVWEEVDQNKRLNKYNHSAIDEQFQFYQSDGLVKFNESDSSAPLPSYVPEGSFIVRAHTPMSNLFSCLWFNEVDRFTSRDQLSFAYTFLKLRRMNPGKPFFLNMFKDCERRAMAKIFHHRVENTSSPGTSTIL